MKKIILLLNIVWLFSASILFSQVNIENIFTEANELYNEGKYSEAITYYNKIIKSEFHSAELYYNLANTYYKLDSIPSSVYYYEKALKLNPNDKDIIDNLKFKKCNLIKKNPFDKSFLKKISQDIYVLNKLKLNQKLL